MQNLQAAARAKCPACQPLLACEKTKAAPTKRRRRQPSLRQGVNHRSTRSSIDDG